MEDKSLVLVVNPGSASRKYALYADGEQIATVFFEFENNKIISVLNYKDKKSTDTYDDDSLVDVSRYVMPLLKKKNIICESEVLNAIGIRVVAPSKRFTQDELVTDESVAALESLQERAPLHIKTALVEIKKLKTYFEETPIIIISDSAFHSTKPEWASRYGIDTEIADKYDIKRYGFHGISVGSVVCNLKKTSMLPSKVIICHIGSGSSITAVVDGKSVDTTMGYTPLEGLMMETRCGSIDPSAVMAIKRELKLEDNSVEEYLNKKCGLIGVSGKTGDVRQLLAAEEAGDERAALALKMYSYRIQQAIGQMAASMGGVDQLVFTATAGERSAPLRAKILDNLEYLGFVCDDELNKATFEPKELTDIGTTNSKPIIIICTDESSEIARRAKRFIEQLV